MTVRNTLITVTIRVPRFLLSLSDIRLDTIVPPDITIDTIPIYDIGSGAKMPVPAPMIKAVRRSISLPIIVGGGLRSEDDIKNALEAGADIVVWHNSR